MKGERKMLVALILVIIGAVLATIGGWIPSPWSETRYVLASLHEAAKNGEEERIRKLASSGENVDTQIAYDMKTGSYKEVTALMVAARYGKEKAVVALLESSKDIAKTIGKLDEAGHSALNWAAMSNYPRIVKILVGEIQEKDIKNVINNVNRHSYSALIEAAAHGCRECVVDLICANADSGIRSKDGTAAQVAKSPEIRRLLRADKSEVCVAGN